MTDIWENVLADALGEAGAKAMTLRESEIFRSMGSEIERAMAASFALLVAINSAGDGVRFHFGPPDPERMGDDPVSYYLSPQHVIGPYRVDFLLGFNKYPALRDAIVIECDGHQWHEKTKEQAANDKARDRYLSGEVGRVLRFTGSEIYRSPGACWAEVFPVFRTMHHLSRGDE